VSEGGPSVMSTPASNQNSQINAKVDISGAAQAANERTILTRHFSTTLSEGKRAAPWIPSIPNPRQGRPSYTQEWAEALVSNCGDALIELVQ
jgi:hypothetical protein